jgi:hypothetical protein
MSEIWGFRDCYHEDYLLLVHLIVQLAQFFQPHYGPGVDSASNMNEYQESSWGKRAASAQSWQPHRHLWANCLETVGALMSHNPVGFHGLLQG